MKDSTIKPGDIYCNQEPTTHKYFAYQLIKIRKGNIAYLLLDYFADVLPTESDIQEMAPQISERWFWNNSKKYCYSGSEILPEGAVYIGNKQPLVTEECKTYGSWPTGREFIDEFEWQIGNRETYKHII